MRVGDFRFKARQAMQGKWGTLALMAFIASAIMGACSGIGAFVPLVSIGVLFLEAPLMLGKAKVALRVFRGEEIVVEDMFAGFQQFTKAVLLQLVNGVIIFLWSLLLIVPGVIKSLEYFMSLFILADNPSVGITEARKKSSELMIGHRWELFCLLFSFIWWYLLSLLTLGILLFWVEPYVATSVAAFYENLLAEKGVKADVAGTEPFDEMM